MGWHAWTTIRLGLRRRSVLLLVVLTLLVSTAGVLFSQFSGRQPATLGVDFTLSAFRIIGVLLALFWTHEVLVKELEQGTVRTLLSLPQPRSHYLLGRFAGVVALLAGTLALFGAGLAAVGWAAGGGYDQPTPIQNGWPIVTVLGFLWLDLVTITAFALLMATVSTTPMLPLAASLAFAWAARALGPVLGYLQGGDQSMPRLGESFGGPLNTLRWVLPDLSRLDIRSGLLYGKWPEIGALAAGPAMALGYTALLLGLAVWQFRARELG